ncbi:MAG: hypothetical protein IPH03_02335 [Tetrasphaera sp.]|nr:hypothetical protein [Tetrasphaera sp.]
MKRHLLAVGLGLLLALLAVSPRAYADGQCGLSCISDGKSLMVAADMLQLPGGHAPGTPHQFYDYGTAQYCGGTTPTAPGGVDCALMYRFCDDKAGDGPAVWVFQRQIDPDTPWKRLGYTCYPRLIPGTIGMAQIADAFHRTDLAAPTLHIQPEGNVTLVTLPTYVEVRWPTRGFQPGELDTLDPRHWFGMTVTIKPTLTSLTYDFGNGTGAGPTTSTGGPYPTGDITATYTDPGTFTVRADAVYTGYVSIDGSDWIEIPGTAAVTGVPQSLVVTTARNHLYLPGG